MVNRLTEQGKEGTVGERSSSARRTSRRPKGTDWQEVEWQYDAEELGPIERWLEDRDDYPGLTVVEGSTKELTDIYYDTEDWRLNRAGYALRVRQASKGAEATMKSLVSGGDGNLHRRREISERIKSGGVDALRESTGPVGERLGALIGARELRSIFEVYTCRRTFDLLRDEQGDDADGSSREIVQDASGDIRREGAGSRIGEVALDSSEISLGDEAGGSSGKVVQDASGNIRLDRAGDDSHSDEVAPGDRVTRLTRVEVEVDASAADGAEDLLEGFVEAMEEALDLQPTAISKYEAGLFATGQSPQTDPDLGSDTVDASLSVGEVAFAVLRKRFVTMKAHEPGARLGEDPEELHDMRVATRRMRAAIKFFENALPERVRWLRDELKFFAGVLGEVRDLDVQLEQLQGWTGEEGLEDLSKIAAALEERRSEARVRLLETLNSDRYERFESSFAGMLRDGPSEPEESPMAGEHILDAAPDLLSRPYRKWRKAAKRLDSSSDPKEYHDLRKKGKRFRYALEFLSGVYGEKATDRLVKPLKKLQDGLGRHQDLIVAGDLLEEIVAIGPRRITRRTAFTMGALAGNLRQEATGLRASLPHSKAYRKLAKGKAWKRFEKATKKAAGKKR